MMGNESRKNITLNRRGVGTSIFVWEAAVLIVGRCTAVAGRPHVLCHVERCERHGDGLLEASAHHS